MKKPKPDPRVNCTVVAVTQQIHPGCGGLQFVPGPAFREKADKSTGAE